MLKPFLFINNQLIINEPEILLLKEFKDLWEYDTSKNKEYAYKVLTFVYLMEDLRSSIMNMSTSKRLIKSLESSGLTELDLAKPIVKNAITCYVDLFNSRRKLRLIRSMLYSIDQLCDFFGTINFKEKITEGAAKGRYQHDLTKYGTMLKQADVYMTKISDLEEQIQKEMETMSEEGKIRGDARKSKLMKEALSNTKN